MTQQLLRQQLIALRNQAGNTSCADCGANDPEWTSVSQAVFICINCSGLHRAMGTHISKVKSIKLDDWNMEMIQAMKDGGNVKANARLLAVVPPLFVPLTEHSIRAVREQFIRAKYERREFEATSEADAKRHQIESGYIESILQKRGKENLKWLPRYCLLRDGVVTYRISKEDKVVKGEIPLIDAVICMSPDPAKDRVFCLMHRGRMYYFEATTTQYFYEWHNALRCARARALGWTGSPTDEEGIRKALSILDSPRKTGNLDKQGPKMKGWRRRYFVLQERYLAYFKSPMDSEVCGYIKLGTAADGYRAARIDSTGTQNPLCFSVICPSRTFSIQAESPVR